MSITNLTKQNFDEYTGKTGIVLVDVWADWCGPCKQFAPVYEKAAIEFNSHTFTKLDVMEDKSFVMEIGIEDIPTLMIYRDGLLIYREAGSPPLSILQELIRKAEELDMEEVQSRRSENNL